MRLMLVVLLLTSSSSIFGQFRWRKEEGSALAPQDFPFTQNFVAGSRVRLRLAVCNGSGHKEAAIIRLQYRCGRSGQWTTVSDTIARHDFVMAGSSPYVTDNQPVTAPLIRDNAGARFAGGRLLVSTWRFSDTIDAGAKKEYEWCIRPSRSVKLDSVYQFRLLFPGIRNSPPPEAMYRSGGAIPGQGATQDQGAIPDQGAIYRDSLVTGFFDRKSGWIASDGCISIPLSDGRDLWTMGDSYIGNLDTMTGTTGCLFQVRNAGLLQPLGNWAPAATSTLIGHTPQLPSLFRNDPNPHNLLWPTGGYQLGDTVYVYNSSQKDTIGGLGFAHGGNDFMAKMLMPGLQVVGYDALSNFGGVEFGVGFDTEEPGDYIYTWGIQSAYITCHIVVARFPRNNPRGPWAFWNGKTWDTTVSHMASIATGASNASYVAKVRNKYVMVSTEFSVSCDAGTHIYAATSDSLTGPFTVNKLLYTIPDDDLGHVPFFYGPAVHPEYINSRNELLITYDINCYTPCEPSCINNGFNPDYYRPRGLRVPLSLIDPGLGH